MFRDGSDALRGTVAFSRNADRDAGGEGCGCGSPATMISPTVRTSNGTASAVREGVQKVALMVLDVAPSGHAQQTLLLRYACGG